jgi:hypothetical protein
MTNGHDKPVVLHPLFATTFNQVFGEPTPKKDTRSEDKQEGRQKEKKRRDDE